MAFPVAAVRSRTFLPQVVLPPAETSVALSKTAYRGHDDGASAPGVDLVYGTLGDAITYVYRVTNTGSTYLDVLDIVDATVGIDLADMLLASGPDPLPPAGTATYYYETTVVSDQSGSATVTANPVESDGDDLPGYENVMDSDGAAVERVAPTLTVEKLVYLGHDNGESA
jgi:hypothetical protein